MSKEHVNCGGNLVLDHTDKSFQHSKTYYKCEKCGQVMNVISFPSYEELVMSHQLWVSKPEYYRVKEKWRLLHKLA